MWDKIINSYKHKVYNTTIKTPNVSSTAVEGGCVCFDFFIPLHHKIKHLNNTTI